MIPAPVPGSAGANQANAYQNGGQPVPNNGQGNNGGQQAPPNGPAFGVIAPGPGLQQQQGHWHQQAAWQQQLQQQAAWQQQQAAWQQQQQQQAAWQQQQQFQPQWQQQAAL